MARGASQMPAKVAPSVHRCARICKYVVDNTVEKLQTRFHVFVTCVIKSSLVKLRLCFLPVGYQS